MFLIWKKLQACLVSSLNAWEKTGINDMANCLDQTEGLFIRNPSAYSFDNGQKMQFLYSKIVIN